MEQLVLDQPTPLLRLVVSDGRPPSGAHYRQAAELGYESRRLHRRVLEWSFAQPASWQRVDPHALRVVLAARQSRHAGPTRRFLADDIWRLLMIDIVQWCRNRRLDVPPGCATALSLLIRCLDDLGELHPDSDQPRELLVALDECTGGLDLRSSTSRR